MELRLLRYFLTVAKEQSFTKAAEQLHITQPTLSRQMAAFEEDLGITLFIRSGKKISLTDEGILLKRRALEILNLEERTLEELKGKEEVVESTITIGCGEFAAVETLAKICKTYKEKYPLVQIVLHLSLIHISLITMETEIYQIDGKKGNWIATDTIIIDGKQFYLMEHQVYRDQAQGVILDAYGKMVVEECKKFDEKTKQKIHDYIQQQVPLNPVEQLKQDGKIRLEHYQKFYQNGTYERSIESGTEANYDMVDGLVNNQKKNPEKISDAHSNKQTSRNQQDNKPKKRRSVIKRLHQKQIAIARRSGKPIPKYLDQEMERKRG